MDWTQTLTIIATVIASVFAFYKLTRDEIAVIREDMKHMDAKWERLFSLFIEQHKQK